MLPTVNLCGTDVTRLIIGGNPFAGFSHMSKEHDAQMMDYYNTERIKQALFRAEMCGINTMQVRADRHAARYIREFRAEGGTLHWVAQTAGETSIEFTTNLAKGYNPIAIYHHGSVSDRLFLAGNIDELKRNLAVIRATGKPVGLGSHLPELVARAEEEKWDVDFYMTCLYNIMKPERTTDTPDPFNNGEPFDEPDRDLMLDVVRAVSKPCLVFKLLGGGRRCSSPEDVRDAFTHAYRGMKATDAAVVGMFTRDKDQVAENAALVSDILSE